MFDSMFPCEHAAPHQVMKPFIYVLPTTFCVELNRFIHGTILNIIYILEYDSSSLYFCEVIFFPILRVSFLDRLHQSFYLFFYGLSRLVR